MKLSLYIILIISVQSQTFSDFGRAFTRFGNRIANRSNTFGNNFLSNFGNYGNYDFNEISTYPELFT